jgi:hypothetical protein
MTRTEVETRLVEKCRALPLDILEETLDFMEFVAAKRLCPSPSNQNRSWQQDFLSISQWNVTEEEIAIRSWQIKSF